MKRTFLVDSVLFTIIFTVVKSVALVLVFPGYWTRLPPVVNRVQCCCSFLGRKMETMQRYVTALPHRISLKRIDFIVFVPFGIPSLWLCMRQPNSSLQGPLQKWPSLQVLSSLYCAICFVSGLKTLPLYAACSKIAFIFFWFFFWLCFLFSFSFALRVLLFYFMWWLQVTGNHFVLMLVL